MIITQEPCIIKVAERVDLRIEIQVPLNQAFFYYAWNVRGPLSYIRNQLLDTKEMIYSPKFFLPILDEGGDVTMETYYY